MLLNPRIPFWTMLPITV